MQKTEFDLDVEVARHDQGHCWYLAVPFDVALGDTSDEAHRSTLELFEDGRVLGPAHAPHDTIRNAGAGAFSHWNDALFFSTSDNSDPRLSGRRYTIRAAQKDFGPDETDLRAAFRLAGEPHNYPDLPGEDFERAIDLARAAVNDVIALLPQSERASAAMEVRRKLASLKGVVFEDISGFSRHAAAFERRLAEHRERYRNGRSVHLELGSYITWPDTRAAAFIAENGLGDMIRLDMNPDYRPDVAASVTALPFADETVDVISSNSLFEHVAYPHDVIREAFRVLRPGGILMTAVPFHFVRHGCPNDYLRYTGQFFEEVCGRTGFEPVITDTWGASGVYYTLHQLLKGATAGLANPGPRSRVAQIAHLMTMTLFASLQGFDDEFDHGGPDHFHATRAIAVKPGDYVAPAGKPDRSKPFVERFPHLICPASGLPLRHEGDELISLDGARRYRVENGIPNLFVLHGFNSSFAAPASSRRALAEWNTQQGLVNRLIRRLAG